MLPADVNAGPVKSLILTFIKKRLFRKDTTSGLYLTAEEYQSCLD
jgi:hypothetical protein